MKRLRIRAGDVVVEAVLEANATTDAIWEILPLEAPANVWGEEIYFTIPVELPQSADARAAVDVGTVAFWSPGSALCLFFGPTPISRTGEIRAASPVNVFGHIDGDVTPLKRVRDGETVRVEQV